MAVTQSEPVDVEASSEQYAVTIRAPAGSISVRVGSITDKVASEDGDFQLTGVSSVETEYNTPTPGKTTIYVMKHDGREVILTGENIHVRSIRAGGN